MLVTAAGTAVIVTGSGIDVTVTAAGVTAAVHRVSVEVTETLDSVNKELNHLVFSHVLALSVSALGG